MVAVRNSPALQSRIDLAVSRLMANRLDGERVRLSVPVLYPSGNGSAVEIIVNGDRCFVSDMALGHTESEFYGAQDFYGSCARSAAQKFGVGYDGLSVFASWASLDNVEGVIAGVANASVQAASAAIFSAVEEKEKQKTTELFERVQMIFGKHVVAKTAELTGRDAQWQAHNVVTLSDHRRAVFEFVSEHVNSISSKFLMFSDLSKNEGAYSLNSVVNNIDGIGKKGQMLASVSNVFPLKAQGDEYMRFARAA